MVNGFDFYIDYVLCIDGSFGMKGAPIDSAKEYATTLFEETKAFLVESGFNIGRFRIKVIVFRDYAFDGKPMEESRFFTLCGGDVDDTAEYLAFVNGIEAKGGGEKSNGFEALALAFRSDWSKNFTLHRRIVQIISNREYLPLQARKDCDGYPVDMPADLEGLRDLYEKCGRKARLFVFGPEFESNMILWEWPNTVWDLHYNMGQLTELDRACFNNLSYVADY